MTIGEKIRNARRLRDYTQAELGSMVKLPGDMLRKYEKFGGGNMIPFKDLFWIFVGMEWVWFITTLIINYRKNH